MESGVVEVWRADLAAADDDLASLLSPDEAERAARFARAADGRRWARGRGILRVLLGRHLDAEPQAVRLAVGEGGKPELADPASTLRFNLSHSADVALFAFAEGRAVGVDVEVRRRPLDHVALARRLLGPAEANRLAALAPAAREREFLRAWARYEAELKCGAAGPVWVADLDVGPGAGAAVAVEGPACEIRRRDWP